MSHFALNNTKVMKKTIFIWLLLCQFAHASKLYVPASFATIQSAILASTNGDTVVVSPGTYFENLNFRGRKIVLTSLFYLAKDTSYICSTVINGSSPVHPDTASCIILNSGEDSTTIIQGFTITGGLGTKWFDIHGAGTYREGGGILTEFSSPIIQYNLICNNYVTNNIGVAGTGGGAIRCGDGKPKLLNNIIRNNKAGYGGGIVFNYCTKGTIQNNLIINNTGGQAYGGGGVWLTGASTASKIDIINNTIANNHIYGTGTYAGKGGALFIFTIQANLKNNIIWGNTQTTGSALVTYFGGTIVATYCNSQNTLTGTGNISSNPNFVDTTNFYLPLTSPCVDAGDPSITLNDVTSGTVAVFPSMGSQINDMGVYGGPRAFAQPVCASFLTTGIEENEYSNSNPLLLFPNPCNDNISIFSKVDQNIYIADSQGKIVMNFRITKGNNTKSINNLLPGIYFLSNGSNTPVKFIKN